MRMCSTVLLSSVGVLAAALVLVACGGSSPSSSAANERAREQQAETKFADFAKCMREHGINAEVATMPNGGRGLKIGPGRGPAESGPGQQVRGPGGGPVVLEAAEKACARYRPEPQRVNLSPQQRVQQEEAVQKFARCMREHGIKVEASAKGGDIQIQIHGHPGGGPNPESPGFQQTQSTCQKLLPGGGPGGASAPAKSGGLVTAR